MKVYDINNILVYAKSKYEALKTISNNIYFEGNKQYIQIGYNKEYAFYYNSKEYKVIQHNKDLTFIYVFNKVIKGYGLHKIYVNNKYACPFLYPKYQELYKTYNNIKDCFKPIYNKNNIYLAS